MTAPSARILLLKRRKWDLNPRTMLITQPSGFQDRPLKPLGYFSIMRFSSGIGKSHPCCTPQNSNIKLSSWFLTPQRTRKLIRCNVGKSYAIPWNRIYVHMFSCSFFTHLSIDQTEKFPFCRQWAKSGTDPEIMNTLRTCFAIWDGYHPAPQKGETMNLYKGTIRFLDGYCRLVSPSWPLTNLPTPRESLSLVWL